MMRYLLLTAPLLLAGCVNERPGRPLPPPRDECRPGPAQRFVGRVFRPAVAQQAKRLSGARSVRVIRPGMAVTMDYRGDRLNVTLDARNVVTGLRCG